jgi:serine/threonine protein kinase/tetratricopeptide (TPR) repeat protein
MHSSDPAMPQRLANFEVLRRLGSGGMAEVFLARKKGAERTYKLLVVKRILPQHLSSPQFRTMFADEAQLATRLNHPNIVQVYDFLDSGDDGQLLSMEYVEGPDLRRLQRAARAQGTRIPAYVASFIAAEVAKGLHYAHERCDERGQPLDIVHRDVSPQNILLSIDGSVKIADFGIASANVFREESGVLKGKTAYMSPEQARGERVDRRTDIYSLGVVLYEMLTNRPVHGTLEGDELLQAVRTGLVEPPSTFATGIPPEIETIVMRALSRETEQRFATARDFASALARVLVQRQQLIDAHVLETTIAELAAGDPSLAEFSASSSQASPSNQQAERTPTSDPPASISESIGKGRPLRERTGREVRHVAVVTLRLHRFPQLLAELGENRARRFIDQLRAILSEIAYKRGCHWLWVAADDEGMSLSARAVVGLSGNAAHAAADAAWLGVDSHEAIIGACDGLSTTLMASVGIVRGIASGIRDPAGHLVRHVLHQPADELAKLIGQHANAGETWVAGGLYRLVRKDFLWRDAPTIEIPDADTRNLPRNVRVHVLDRPLTRSEKLELAAQTPRDLIGRNSELAELQSAYHRAVSPSPPARGAVTSRVIVGEMGIGKTALVEAFIADLPEQVRVVRIDCSPAQRELPLSHIGQWLREITGIRLDTPYDEAHKIIVEAMGEPGPNARAQEIVTRMTELTINRIAEAHDESDLRHHQRLIMSGVRRFFGRASLSSPLVAVLDGIQWCDVASLEILMTLARRADPSPILVLMLTRPDERITALLEGVVRIELTGLSTDNQLQLVRGHIGATEGVAEVCHALLPRAGGNPFFLLEMVDTLLERGALDLVRNDQGEQVLVRVERAGEEALALPSTLEQLIADRLNELPPAERGIVDWLAVAGGPLALRDLSVLASDAEEHVARLCARGLCDTKDHVVDVRHPLSRDVAYLALSRPERARMHNALGECFAKSPLARGLSAALIARHFARGNNREAAGEYYLRAAMAARRSYHLDMATRYLRRVVAVLPADDPRIIGAYEVLENNCRIQGRPRDRRHYLDALRRVAHGSGRPGWVALALVRSARFDLDEGRLTQGLELAEQGEQLARAVKAASLEVEAQRLTAEMLRELGDMQGALAACDRALRTATTSHPSSRLKAEVLRARGMLLLRVGRVNEAVSAHTEAIGVFRRTGARRLESRAKNSLASAMFVRGHYSDAIALALEAVRIDLAIGGRFQIGRTLSTIGQSYARLGDYDRAENYLRRARDAHQRYGDHDGRAGTLLGYAELQLTKGDLKRAEALMDEAAELSAATGSAYDAVHEKLLRALTARARGKSNAAVMHAFDARQVAEVQAYVAFHFYAMALEAVARVDLGEQHTGILLATTALGALQTLQGSEYGLETRALCCDALQRAGSPQAAELWDKAQGYAVQLLEQIRDPELREKFCRRSEVALLLGGRASQQSV